MLAADTWVVALGEYVVGMQARNSVLRFLIIGSLGLLLGCTAYPAKQTLEASGTTGPPSASLVPASLSNADNGSLTLSGSSAYQPVPTVAVLPPVTSASPTPTTSTQSSPGLTSPGSGSGWPVGREPTDGTRSEAEIGSVRANEGSAAGLRLVAAARSQIGVTTGYDPAYVGLSFPGGDVDETTGVCSDVVVRALRGLGIDLQERVNLDMLAHFGEYPTKWGLSSPDPNIDHRRVPNLATYFARRGYEQPVTNDPANYQPGDIVWIKLPLDHTGIVSDRTVEGRPLLIHNVGQGAREEDVLFSWKIVGHYRVVR